ncbi:hypothetical protein scyTo_0010060 [Scyliorhinus torazame]|uniref:Ig-like domain-containing protein n=1 Tax=Scyliorhinus torazame TaxID=75743 RepID=A0A401NZ75_SCYTO|nr:hypothetical protein [Scyliorhinus torazame]
MADINIMAFFWFENILSLNNHTRVLLCRNLLHSGFWTLRLDDFFEIRFHSRKAMRVEMKHSMKRLQVTLLSLASLIALAEPGFPVAEKVRTFLVPPVVSFNIENRLNDTMTAICTASNGKPAAEITWHPKDLGNFSINITHHGNRTVTVRSQYNIGVHLFSEEVICIVSHPAFDGTQNYTIPMQGPHDSQPTPDNLIHLYLVAGVLAACLGLLVATLVILRYFDLQNQAAFR